MPNSIKPKSKAEVKQPIAKDTVEVDILLGTIRAFLRSGLRGDPSFCACPQNFDTAPDGTMWQKLDGEMMPIYPPPGPGYHLVSGANGVATWEEM